MQAFVIKNLLKFDVYTVHSSKIINTQKAIATQGTDNNKIKQYATRKPKQNTEKYEFQSLPVVETKDGGFNEMK